MAIPPGEACSLQRETIPLSVFASISRKIFKTRQTGDRSQCNRSRMFLAHYLRTAATADFPCSLLPFGSTLLTVGFSAQAEIPIAVSARGSLTTRTRPIPFPGCRQPTFPSRDAVQFQVTPKRVVGQFEKFSWPVPL